MLGTLARWLLGTLLVLSAAALLALGLAVEGAPSVAPRPPVAPADIERAVALARLHDPRLAPPGQPRRVVLAERDLDLLLDHAARRWTPAATRVRLLPGALALQASLPAPLGRWLNVEVGLRQTDALPVVDRLRVGRLPLPPGLALPVLQALAQRRGVQLEALMAVEWVERVAIDAGRMTVTYRIDPGTAKRLRAALVPPDDAERLRAYGNHLAALSHHVAGDRVPLVPLLAPMLALAAQRSAQGGDALAEARSALLTLTVFANHRSLGLLAPQAVAQVPARPLTVTLNGRDDLALHFLVSAVIAAEAGTPLADAVGVWKELDDTRAGGSGFSFVDLAADRAGTRFGERLRRDPAGLLARGTAGFAETDLMPSTTGLPEFLPAAVFAARFGGVGSLAYERLLADIEARVAALPSGS